MGFDLDRIVFDRSVWSVFFPNVVKNSDQNHYDSGLIDRLDLDHETKPTRYKGMGTEKVLYYEYGSPKPYLKIEIRLRQTKSMRVVFNFNRYFFQKFNMIHDIRMPVIHDDNFLPADTTIKTEDFLEVFNNKLPLELERIYREKFEMLWPKEYAILENMDEQLVIKCVTLELAREMKPLNVDDIHSEFVAKGNAIKKFATPMASYNSQSKTMLFGERPETELQYFENDAVLSANVEVWNWKDPYEHVRQGKLYQKSFDLARFEITLYDQQIDIMSKDPIEDLKFILDEYAESCGLVWKPTTKTYDEMKIFIAEQFKIDVVVIDTFLKNNFVWNATVSNRKTTQRLLRKGLIIKMARGRYVGNPKLKKIFEGCIEEKVKLKYVPKYL